MKELKMQNRLYIAEKLISMAFGIAPNNSPEGKRLKGYIAQYFMYH